MSDATTAGDTTTLVEEHLPLVGQCVGALMQRMPPTVDRDDLAAAGALALVLAARSYDPDTHVPFARYAVLRIRGALLDELRARDWASRGARRRARLLVGAQEELQATLWRTPTREELADTLGIEVSALEEIRAESERRLLSLDVPDVALLDQLCSDDRTPEEEALADERLRWLRAAIAELPERLRAVIRGLYLEGLSGVEVAQRLGVTQSRISQFRADGLAMLRDGFNAAFDPELVETGERRTGAAQRRRDAFFAAIAARAAGRGCLDTMPTQRVATLPTQRVDEREAALV